MDSKSQARDNTPLNTYNLTQTMNPYYHKFSIHKQYFNILTMYKKVLEHLYVTDATIAIELTETGNIHFHVQLTTILSDSEFKLTYAILTKSLGYSKIKPCTSQEYQEAFIEYIKKDLVKTARMFNAYSDLSRKDLPKGFKEFTINSFLIKIKKPIEILFSHYNNIQCQDSNEQLGRAKPTDAGLWQELDALQCQN